MPKKIIYIFFPLIIFLLILSSCSKLIYKYSYPALEDGEYDNEYPYDNFSNRIEEIGVSVKLLNTIVFYKSYVIHPEVEITLKDINRRTLKENADKAGGFDRSSAGTATIIFSQDNKVALLTTDHIVNFPDTIITYRQNESGAFTNSIQSISVIANQEFYIPDFPDGGKVEIIAQDKEMDIAIVGKKYDFSELKTFPVIKYPAGSAKDLKWGTVVYILGYPLNYKMITRALVSSPNRDSDGDFLLDAVFNRGFSGGIVLAVRDGIPNFEIVGMVNWAAGEREYILKPDSESLNYDFIPLIPYEGESFVDQKINIKYGITKAIPIESIKKFIKKYKRTLIEAGYDLSFLLTEKEIEK